VLCLALGLGQAYRKEHQALLHSVVDARWLRLSNPLLIEMSVERIAGCYTMVSIEDGRDEFN
jgi:hypothetical protein